MLVRAYYRGEAYHAIWRLTFGAGGLIFVINHGCSPSSPKRERFLRSSFFHNIQFKIAATLLN